MARRAGPPVLGLPPYGAAPGAYLAAGLAGQGGAGSVGRRPPYQGGSLGCQAPGTGAGLPVACPR